MAVEAFIADMLPERPVPPDLQRRGVAHAQYQWAWYCIDGRVAYGFATRLLLHALVDDWRLVRRVARQVAKMILTRVGLR